MTVDSGLLFWAILYLRNDLFQALGKFFQWSRR